MSTWTTPHTATRRTASSLEAAASWLTRLVDTAFVWSERVRQRRQIGSLPDHLLKDIGISRADAEAERLKAFWQE